MATLLKSGGERVEIAPANGRTFTLKELQEFVGGYIELVTLADGRHMFVNEDGKSLAATQGRINLEATTLFLSAGGMPEDFIVGDAVVLTMKETLEETKD